MCVRQDTQGSKLRTTDSKYRKTEGHRLNRKKITGAMWTQNVAAISLCTLMWYAHFKKPVWTLSD